MPARLVALRLLRSRSYLLDATCRRRMSVREIAAELGVHRTTVREWMREHDVPPVQRP